MLMTEGVGQGDVLSPLLFNLVIEPLTKMLLTDLQYAGVTVAGVNLRDKKYADDIPR
jgi:hypothetical protein